MPPSPACWRFHLRGLLQVWCTTFLRKQPDGQPLEGLRRESAQRILVLENVSGAFLRNRTHCCGVSWIWNRIYFLNKKRPGSTITNSCSSKTSSLITYILSANHNVRISTVASWTAVTLPIYGWNKHRRQCNSGDLVITRPSGWSWTIHVSSLIDHCTKNIDVHLGNLQNALKGRVVSHSLGVLWLNTFHARYWKLVSLDVSKHKLSRYLKRLPLKWDLLYLVLDIIKTTFYNWD